MSESSSWYTLRRYLIRELTGCDIQRIEDKLASGIPDANVCWAGREFWLEGKQLRDLPARSTTYVRPELRPDQRNWIKRRKDAGGTAFVWLRVNNVGWWLFTGILEIERLVGEKLPFYTKEELLALPHDKNCQDFVQRIKRALCH